MNSQPIGPQPWMGCIATLLLGSLGVLTAPPVLAQHSLETTWPLHMAQSSPALSGSWQLVNMTESGAPTPMVPLQSAIPTAEFSGDRISGSGGCNRFMGGFQTDSTQLSIGPLASTFMACEDPIMGQEVRYLQALEGAQRYEINGQDLTIFYQTTQSSGVLRFTAQSVRGLW